MKNSLYLKIKNYKVTELTNEIIYFLSHALIFKHFFHEDLVNEYTSKEGINLAVNSISILYKFLKKIIYIFILIILFDGYGNVFGIYFLLLTLAGCIFRKINKYNIDDYDMIRLFKTNSNKYGKYLINEYVIKELIFMSLAMLLIYVEFEINYCYLLFLVITYVSMHLISEVLFIKETEKNKFELKNLSILRGILIVIILVILFALYLLEIYISNEFIFYLSIPIIVFGFISYNYLTNYKKYDKLYKNNLNVELINNVKNIENINRVNASEMNKSLVVNAHEDKLTGYEYLYSMFLKRYGKNLRNGDILVYIIISIAILIGLIIPNFLEISSTEYVNNLFNSLAMFFFGIYIISLNGKKILSLCFFQVDRYLINYNFYRTEESIDKNLRLRLKTIIKKNIFPSLFVSFGLFIIFLIYGKELELSKLFVVVLLPIILSMFFSIYHITMYYLFQPYTFDGRVENKMFQFIDTIVYLTVYFMFDADITLNLNVLLIIMGVLFMISIILYILVLKRGPKSFRVR